MVVWGARSPVLASETRQCFPWEGDEGRIRAWL